MTAILAKKALASQSALSRFFNRMDDNTLNQFYDLMRRFRKVVYSIKSRKDLVSYAVCYGKFFYQANSWNYSRRIVCKIEKSTEQLVYMYTFSVTNMDSKPEDVIHFYCKRSAMENYINESKNGFDFTAVSSFQKS